MEYYKEQKTTYEKTIKILQIKMYMYYVLYYVFISSINIVS